MKSTGTAKRVTVYCGSSASLPERYLAAARQVGEALARRGATVIYGAGRTGLMGAVADAAQSAGGRVVGIIPQFMVDRGWHRDGLDSMIVTDTMHARKALLADTDACIALPGGIGTFEELTEVMTMRQLGLFGGNIVIANIDGYYDPFLAMLERAVAEGFMRPDHRSLYAVAADAAGAVELALADPHPLNLSAKF